MAEREPPSDPGVPTGPAARDTDFGRVESWFAALGLSNRHTRPAALDDADANALMGMFAAEARQDGRDHREAASAPTLPPAAQAAARAPATASAREAEGRAPAGPAPSRRLEDQAGPAPSPRRRAAGRQGPATPKAAPEHAPPGLSARLYAAFSLSRLGLAVLLLSLPWLQGLLQVALPQLPYGLVSLGYVVLTALAVRSPDAARRLFGEAGFLMRRWLLATVGVDLLAFTVFLEWLGGSINVAALFAVPVLVAGTLSGRLVALATAAAATFVLLGRGLLVWEGPDAPALFTQAGLTCAGLFALAWLMTELTARLAREERSARSSLALARQQALLNRLVIEEMDDGVLVVDRSGRVRVANPAALRLVGAPDDHRLRVFSLHDRVRWQPLLAAVEQAFRAGSWPEAGQDLVLSAPRRASDGAGRGGAEDRPLRVRMRFTRRRQQELGESLCVVFLEDLRTLRLRARQDKLAAMGRVSAGIAHEIRNPLAAIAQANALLAEDLTHPAQQRLSRMVTDNVERLRRIVDDVMAAAPGGDDRSAPLIDLPSHVRQLVADWARTNDLTLGGADARVDLRLPGPHDGPDGELAVPVRIEPDHLARVLVNLLDNALNHGSKRAGAICVELRLALRARADDSPARVEQLARQRGGPQIAILTVGSDGAPIPAEVESLLFEPFFSTRSRGTGLGLYICRELCERHGVSIDYQRGAAGARHLNQFVLRVPMVSEPAQAPPAAPDASTIPVAGPARPTV